MEILFTEKNFGKIEEALTGIQKRKRVNLASVDFIVESINKIEKTIKSNKKYLKDYLNREIFIATDVIDYKEFQKLARKGYYPGETNTQIKIKRKKRGWVITDIRRTYPTYDYLAVVSPRYLGNI